MLRYRAWLRVKHKAIRVTLILKAKFEHTRRALSWMAHFRIRIRTFNGLEKGTYVSP